MKTSIIDVHRVLLVFSVDEVQRQIGEGPGVESATVRYDEARLDVADIKSGVRQRWRTST